jgi:hypothetical protein
LKELLSSYLDLTVFNYNVSLQEIQVTTIWLLLIVVVVPQDESVDILRVELSLFLQPDIKYTQNISVIKEVVIGILESSQLYHIHNRRTRNIENEYLSLLLLLSNVEFFAHQNMVLNYIHRSAAFYL